jgi:hypothetical protein
MRGRSRRRASFLVRAAAVALALLAMEARDVAAGDPATAARDLDGSDDFRVRVSAALTLGRARPPGARVALEHALGDSHPAVRTAAAAALAALADAAAIPALQARMASEQAAGARSQMATAIAALAAQPTSEAVAAEQRWRSSRYVVAIGAMHNRSEVRGAHATEVLRAAARARAASLPGVFVSDGAGADTLELAASHHLPVLLIEGALQRLRLGRRSAEVSYSAQVDFSMRRVPQQQLRGMLSGAATSFGSTAVLGDAASITQLEDQAIEGAVESAMRGAAQGFGDALR